MVEAAKEKGPNNIDMESVNVVLIGPGMSGKSTLMGRMILHQHPIIR